jgi:hypothetical protein
MQGLLFAAFAGFGAKMRGVLGPEIGDRHGQPNDHHGDKKIIDHHAAAPPLR